MWQRLWKEVESARIVAARPPAELITEADLAPLPPAARDLMAFFHIKAGAPKTWSMQVGWRGHFRLGPERPWMEVEAVQYNTRQPVSRVFRMRARMKGFPVLARDNYIAGRGRMQAKIARLVTVASGKGPEFDQGELVTWVNDGVFFSPCMLLTPTTVWSHVDERTFDLKFSDCGIEVSARVFVAEEGAPINFETTDRFVEDPYDPKHPLVRARWTTPVDRWWRTEGHPLFKSGRAVWHLAGGEFAYAELQPVPEMLAFDVFPTSMVAAVPA
jgi:hypothetical protein